MFITEEDYIQVGPDALKIMQQSSTDNRKTAEQRAMSRIAAALRARYDVDATFAAKAKNGTRNWWDAPLISRSIIWCAHYPEKWEMKFVKNAIKMRWTI